MEEDTPLLAPSPVRNIPSSRRITIEPVHFLYWLYMSGSMPLISQFVHHKIQLKYNASDLVLPCGEPHNSSNSEIAGIIQSESSTWLLYLNVAAMIPGILSTILLSAYSERRGRKVAMVMPLIGAILRIVTFLIVGAFDLHIGVLIISSVLDGAFGMSCTMLMSCFSYLTDITGHRQRSLRVGLLELVAGMAYVVSDLCIGYSIRYLGYMWTFAVLLALLLINLMYVIFVLQESLVIVVTPACTNISVRSSSSFCRCLRACWEPFSRVLRLYVSADDGTKRRASLQLTAVILFIVSVVQLGRQQVQTLFMLGFPFCLSSVLIGYFYVCAYLVTNVSNVAFIRLFAERLGDLPLVLAGCVFGISYELVFGFSVNRIMMFLATVAGCGCLLPISLLRAYNSKIVGTQEIGLMFASMAWIETIAVLIGSTIQNSIYAASVSTMPYAVFLFGAACYVLAAIVTLYGLVSSFFIHSSFHPSIASLIVSSEEEQTVDPAAVQ